MLFHTFFIAVAVSDMVIESSIVNTNLKNTLVVSVIVTVSDTLIDISVGCIESSKEFQSALAPVYASDTLPTATVPLLSARARPPRAERSVVLAPATIVPPSFSRKPTSQHSP